MSSSLAKNVYRERIDFSKIRTTVPIPNLIEIQKKSYDRFLQMYTLPAEREDVGLQAVFKSVFPISDFRENSSLEFIEYSIGNWDECGWGDEARGLVHEIGGRRMALNLKYDINECLERGMTYAIPLKVTIRLVVWNKDPETGAKTIRDIKEQEVYFGDIPLMTDHGTFIINGTERVIVSQLHRSPGAFFHTEDKTLFIGQLIPYRGSWVEFEYDSKNLLYVRIDRKRKFLGTVFLRALGLRNADEMLRAFYTIDSLHLKGDRVLWTVNDSPVDWRAGEDMTIPGSELALTRGKRITKAADQGAAPRRHHRGAGRVQPPRGRAAVLGRRRRRSVVGRGAARGQRGTVGPRPGDGPGEGHRAHRHLLPREGRSRSGAVGDAAQGSDPHARRGADRDLPPPASGRSADAGELAVAVREHVLQPAEVRLLARRPAQAEHQAEAADAARREGAAPAGLLRGHQVPAEAAPQPGQRGRHRSPRQPARALGRRAAREPVPHRPGADGACDQGKDVGVPGNGHRHAARPDQRQAGDGGDPRVLRQLAAVAVHGPDQPALRDHAQAASLGARARRSVA